MKDPLRALGALRIAAWVRLEPLEPDSARCATIRVLIRDASAPRIMAFLLDMDGVLVHSTPVHNEAWRQYLARHGLQFELAVIERVMLGKHNREIVRAFFGDNLTEFEIERHGAEKEKLYRELMRPRLADCLVAGVREFLNRYRHIPMGLASNAEPANVEFILKETGFGPYFQAVLTAQEVNKPKPDPELYLELARRLAFRPPECLVFEDSATGIEAARRAGCRVVGLATTTAALEGADLVVRDFADPALESWLEGMLAVSAGRPTQTGD